MYKFAAQCDLAICNLLNILAEYNEVLECVRTIVHLLCKHMQSSAYCVLSR